MKLSRFSSPLFALSLIEEFTRGVIVRCSRSARAQILQLVVLFAVLTLAPVGMAAGVQRSLPCFDEEVIGAVRTDEQVLGAVVGSDVIPVMYFLGAFEVATEHPLSDQDVLVDVAALIHSGMSGRFFLNVSPWPEAGYSALPLVIALPALSEMVPIVKPHGFTADVTASRFRLLGERGKQTTATHTQTRRIQQSRAPKVCADNAFNLTLSGGFCG